MIWSVAGLVAALALAILAWLRSRSRGTFFEREVYAMSARVHRRYAAIGLAFAALFVLSMRFPGAAIPVAAAFVTVAILYGASFARGYTGEDE